MGVQRSSGGGDGAARGSLWGRVRPEIMGTSVPEARRQVGSRGVIYRLDCTLLGAGGRGASEVSLAWGLCESLCLCLTHPLSLKAALVCWCLRSCRTQGPG